MEERLLHVFRNTPLGRETLLQSLYFCRVLDVGLYIYVPEYTQFLMYFPHDAVQVDLDASYLHSPETALGHATELAEQQGVKPNFLRPKNFTASQLPDIPTTFSYMCCPRSISDLSSKIGLGYIGPKVRRIVMSSIFPVLLPSSVFKEWRRIVVFYGGSNNAAKAVRWGLRLRRATGFPLELFTFTENRTKEYFEATLEDAGLLQDVQQEAAEWHKIAGGKFEDGLYRVDHDALLVVGACGHGLIKDLIFGSKMEIIQSWMPNSMVLVGPNCVHSGP